MLKQSTDQMVGFAKTRYTGKGAAGNIARDMSMLGRMFNTERKQVDTLMASTSVVSTGSLVTWVSSPAQGTTGSTRDGDSIKIVRIDANLFFGYGSGTTNTGSNQVFNYALVRYRKTPSSGGSTPFAISDMYVPDANGNYTPLSLPNNDLIENFQILTAGTIVLENPWATAVNNTVTRVVPLSIECSFHQTFTGSTAASIVDNSLFWVFTALSGANTGGGSAIQASTRVWYVDN